MSTGIRSGSLAMSCAAFLSGTGNPSRLGKRGEGGREGGEGGVGRERKRGREGEGGRERKSGGREHWVRGKEVMLGL